MENVKNSPVNIKFVTKTLDIVLFFLGHFGPFLLRHFI